MNPRRFAVSACTTYRSSYATDLSTYRRAGITGIGLWESKLPAGDDVGSVAALRASGLRASFCFPAVPSVLAGDTLFTEPRDPSARLDRLCEGIRRLAAFEPAAVICYAGPPGDLGESAARRLVVEALRRAGDVAAACGVTLAVEVLRPSRGGSLAPTIEAALELINESTSDNVQVLIDAWHVTDVDGTVAEIARYGDRLVGLQICDRPAAPRSWMDRKLPGDGIIDLARLIDALDATGFTGWYELEVFSDDGEFGHDYPDSLWKRDPLALLLAGKAAFDRVCGDIPM